MRIALRFALIALGAPQLAIGAWATFASRNWYDAFPGLGRQWLGSYGPYNSHLATDVGATFMAIGVLLIIAAWLLDHRTVTIAVVVYLAYSVPHLIFHLSNDEVLGGGDQIFNGALLTATVLGGFGLIWLSARIARSAHTPAP